MRKAIIQNDVIDVIYDSFGGYSLDKAYEILENYRVGKYISIEFIEKQIEITTDINSDELDILYAGNLSYLLKIWEKEKWNYLTRTDM